MDSASALKIEIYLHGQDVVLMGNEEEKTKPLGLIQHIDNKCEKVMEGMCCRKFTRALFTKENYDKIPRGVGVMPFFDIYFWNNFGETGRGLQGIISKCVINSNGKSNDIGDKFIILEGGDIVQI